MSSPVVVGFFGEQQVGKSTHAKYIASHGYYLHSKGATKGEQEGPWAFLNSFAAPLKHRTQLILPNIDVHMFDKNTPIEELGGRTLREEWQADGQALRERCKTTGMSILTFTLRCNIQLNPNATIACVDDLRHPDEYDMIEELPHLFVRIDGDVPEEQHGTSHESELHWRSFEPDLVVNYDKTQESLEYNCKLIIERATDIWLLKRKQKRL